jgi:hypothetical protein
MRIRTLGFNLSGDKPLRNFLVESGFTTKTFYPYNVLELGSFPETLDGVNAYCRTISETDFQAHVGFPANLNFEKEFEIDNETKFIYIYRGIDSWLELFKGLQAKASHSTTYQFEELLCKNYINTNKVLAQDLTDEELRSIYTAHDQKVTTFFAGKPNYIKIELDDPQISAKLRTFLSVVEEIQFDASVESLDNINL